LYGYLTVPIQATYPIYPCSSHASKLIKLSQKVLERRLCCHDHCKYYWLILFLLSYKQNAREY
jgi:hypothetical protein